MKFRNLLIALSISAASSLSLVQAATYNAGDLFLGFSASAEEPGLTVNYVVNLGNSATFRDATGSFSIEFASIAADLASIYGATWFDREDLSWGIIGTNSNTSALNGDPQATIYASRAQSPFGSISSAWKIQSSTNRGTTSTKITNTKSGFLAGSTVGILNPNAVKQTNSDANSWNQGLSNSGFGGSFAGGISGAFGAGAEALDLYRITSANSGTGSLLGTFTLSANGSSLNFTAVPEPGTIALLGLGLAAAVGLNARRLRKQAH